MPRIARVITAMLFFPAMAVPATAGSPQTRYFPHPGGKPFSRAVQVGKFVYVSGAVGVAPDGTYPSEFPVQAANAMDAVAAELKLAGASMDDVYNCRVALTDMNDWDAFNAVYKKYFKPDRLPVRMAVGVTSLGGAAVEVQCDAVLPN
jgi:enamine deaminase RidA (YjgF/YER057c/UK114 family)